MRQEGYYWVKFRESSLWETARYFGGNKWLFVEDVGFIPEEDIFEINESRLLNPDEQSDKYHKTWYQRLNLLK